MILNGFGDVEAAKAQVARLGAPPGYHCADLGDAAQIADMMDYAEREFGGVDILINNAGIQHGAAGSVPGGEMGRHPRHQPVGGVPHLPIGAAGMRERQLGRIINVASVHGLVASKDKSAYVAGTWRGGLTKTLALETARTPVTCNAICPGWVLTPLVQQRIDKRIAAGTDPQRARDELLAEKQPSQAFVTPEQLGELALFRAAMRRRRYAAPPGTWTAVGWRSSEFSLGRATRSVVIPAYYRKTICTPRII